MKRPEPAPGAACPCGSGHGYTACCGPWHAGPLHLQAPTAEALMRSRYSAYARGLADYLQATWHPRTRPADGVRIDPGVKWLGLDITRHWVQDADHAEVHFVARSKFGGRAHRLVERSRFVREDGRWTYVDGTVDGLPGGTDV
jgi:SEC-C motif-containing protein